MAEAAARPNPLELIWSEIHEHNLEPCVAELDAQGYTVIPPELAAPEGLADRLLDACLDVSERRSRIRGSGGATGTRAMSYSATGGRASTSRRWRNTGVSPATPTMPSTAESPHRPAFPKAP